MTQRCSSVRPVMSRGQWACYDGQRGGGGGATFRYAHDGQPAARPRPARGRREARAAAGRERCGKYCDAPAERAYPHFFEGGARRLGGRVRMEPASVSAAAGRRVVDIQDPRSQFFATDVCPKCVLVREPGVPALEMRDAWPKRPGVRRRAPDGQHLRPSSGEKQAVAVASVLAMRPRVVVMDEPSANLDEVATARLRTIVETLLHRGVTVVVSEHRVHYLADLADEALLLRAGRVERRFAAGELARLTPEASHELGLRASSLDEVRAVPRAEARGPAVLEVRDVSFGYRGAPPVLKGTSFSVREGEVVGIVGRNGVGKSTLIDLVCGLKTECAGTVSIGGVALRPKERVRASYLVMQDSDCQLFAESVEAELLLGERADEARTARARAALARMGLAGLGPSPGIAVGRPEEVRPSWWPT
ncbi:MAG: ATP-binding cassette domain-containing protein [Eggerthella lenta]